MLNINNKIFLKQNSVCFDFAVFFLSGLFGESTFLDWRKSTKLFEGWLFWDPLDVN